ncbi:MAG TPA: sigma-54-dependent Fis family transcriptional regulator [Bacteroidetes bacterium]|nr:sigma-54-dependent Fis family transcriptional regulator [Bacteroidota bacterium]
MDRRAVQERFGILGDSPALRHALDRVRQVAAVDITVLLEGESGVGKELFATAIHGLSPRRHKRFVVVNCGAIPEGLIEAELFGAEKGAYTGSVERRAGYFEEADGGTLFLDEIGEMPLQAQVRLLRVLETGQFSRVGSSTVQSADVRIVGATNKDLGEEVRAGRFREDLYYRLSTVIIQIPALRERASDIGPLFESFMRRIARRYDAPVPQLEPGARQLVLRYSWPGNVRELRNVAEQTVVLSQGRTVTADTIRPYLRGISAAAGLAPRDPDPPPGGSAEIGALYRALLEMRGELHEIRDLLAGGRPEPATDFETYDEPEFASLPEASSFSASDTDFELEDDEFEDDFSGAPASFGPPETIDAALAQGMDLPTIEEAEQALLREALRRFDGNRRQTAEALGISERTLYRKVKDLEDEEA